MKTKTEIKKFVLDTLLPYKNDPSTCGYDEGTKNCKYQAANGNMCAFGKHMTSAALTKYQDSGEAASTIIESDGYDILTSQARSMNFTELQWDVIQNYHDRIADSQSVMLSKDRIHNGAIHGANRAVKGIEQEFDIDFPQLRLKYN